MRDEQTSGIRRNLVQRARALRHPQTPAEARLWSRLRSGQLGRFKFRRQHPMGHYIADFCCVESRLVIELDGETHAEQQEYDRARTQYMADLGYSVMRISNRELLVNVDGVLEGILSECENRRPGG